MSHKYSDFLDCVEDGFLDCFGSKGYVKETPVKITSRVDKSVDFIGSKISVLKDKVLDYSINPSGHVLIQDCFRLHGRRNLQNTEWSKFGTCFRGMGTLSLPCMEEVVRDTFDYLTGSNYLAIKPEDLSIRISAKDADLLAAIKAVDKRVHREFDSKSSRYVHSYGLDEQGVSGRDFNIAVRKAGTNDFLAVATVVMMEKQERKLAVDMGMSNIVFSMCKYGNHNSLQSCRMADVFEIDSIEKIKLADALVAVATLQNENVENVQSHRKAILWNFRQYNKAIAYWQARLHLSDGQILEYMKRYIDLEFKNNSYRSRVTWQR